MRYRTKSNYLGKRDDDFKNMLFNFLKKGNLKEAYIYDLVDHGFNLFSSAFTSKTVNETENYEMLEQLGDSTANKFIPWYMYKKFPELRNTLGVKVVARLKINYASKMIFHKIGEQLNFWPFISASIEERQRNKKKLLEDCFEALIGATESLLDEKFRTGVGYAIIYEILENIFNTIHISLTYDDLFDPKTKLKELHDYFKNDIGNLTYVEEKQNEFIVSKIEQTKGNIKRYIAIGQALITSDAQQKAAFNALEYFKKHNYIRPPTPLVIFLQNLNKKINLNK